MHFLLRTVKSPALKAPAGLLSQRAKLHVSSPVRAFDLALETEIKNTIAALPPPSKLYTNEDGSHRDPTESELKTLSKLVKLTGTRKISMLQALFMKKEYNELARSNQEMLEELIPSYNNGAAGKIVDKIPYEDAATGEIKWKYVREGEKEGWEGVMYYGFVPAIFLMLGIIMFKPDEGINAWAEKELKLRVQEDVLGDEAKALESLNNSGLSAEDIKKKDEVMVERILGGEYDRLAGLKINENLKLPAEVGN